MVIGAETRKEPIPAPVVDDHGQASGKETAVFAGGCFWGVQSVYNRVKGVTATTAGYSGGTANTANYSDVSSERTEHAESVKIVFDPSKVSYGTLLRIFFSVVHDPTQLNRQGPDVGTSYRSAIFYTTPEQQKVAAAYIEQLDCLPARLDPAEAPDRQRHDPHHHEQPDDHVAGGVEVELGHVVAEPAVQVKLAREQSDDLDPAHEERDADRQRRDRDVVIDLAHRAARTPSRRRSS